MEYMISDYPDRSKEEFELLITLERLGLIEFAAVLPNAVYNRQGGYDISMAKYINIRE